MAAVDVHLLDDLDDGPARVAEMHLGRVELGYPCDILRNIPMIHSTKLNPRHMCYIYNIYIYIIILRCLRLSVVSNLYLSLVDFVMANFMSSILDADPRGMNSMIAYASDLRHHHRTHR